MSDYSSHKFGLRRCLSDSQLPREGVFEPHREFGSTTSLVCYLDNYGSSTEQTANASRADEQWISKNVEQLFDDWSFDSTSDTSSQTVKSDLKCIVKGAASAPVLLFHATNEEREKLSEKVRLQKLPRSKSC
ncbi:hypothetical protein TTRE_0000473101 [Trichuris trichiura]|uniref:Uncharacterized protein n=1 Tax=Trichuris trichiura TaxID=36087 RepID=A0A077Z8A3_TRITR|nr:hypothetical protein TTRE_0000473101 [Trichuris trichiura]